MANFRSANAGVSVVLVIVSFFLTVIGLGMMMLIPEATLAWAVIFFGVMVALMLGTVLAAVGMMNRAKRKNEDKLKHTEYTIGSDGELVPLEMLEDTHNDREISPRNTR